MISLAVQIVGDNRHYRKVSQSEIASDTGFMTIYRDGRGTS